MGIIEGATTAAQASEAPRAPEDLYARYSV